MDIKTQTIINEIAHQRNQFQDAVAMLSGDLAEARALIAQQEETIAGLNKNIANFADVIPSATTTKYLPNVISDDSVKPEAA